MSKMLMMRVAPLMAALFAGLARAEEARSHYNLPMGVTQISRDVHDLHMKILGIVCVIGVLVFGVMIYSIINHRRSKHPKPADFHESTTVEIIWTIIPFFVLIAIAIPAAGTLIRMEDTRNSDLTVKITGFQWGWKYEYVGENYEFVSMLAADSNKARQLGSGIDPNTVPNYLWEVTNPLVLPVGKKVRFLITGQDVIHAWWVHDLAIKKDAIPGYVNEAWTNIDVPGTFRGVCAELCGRDHGFMPIVVKAVPETEFKAWLAQKKGVSVASLAPAPALSEPAAAAPAAATQSKPGLAKITFATGSAEVSTEGKTALADLVAYAKAHADAKLDISGYHDTAGNAAVNAEISKKRAFAVRDALVKAGVAESALVLKKPDDTNAGTGEAARRVDVSLAADAAAPAAAVAAPTEVAAAGNAPAATAKAMSKDELMANGKKVYAANCQACHQENGAGLPPNFPSLAGSKVVNGPAEAHIKHAIKGKNLMPPFGQLSDADLAAVVTYERNSWGNKASVVQPADVAAARQ